MMSFVFVTSHLQPDLPASRKLSAREQRDVDVISEYIYVSDWRQVS